MATRIRLRWTSLAVRSSDLGRLDYAGGMHFNDDLPGMPGGRTDLIGVGGGGGSLSESGSKLSASGDGNGDGDGVPQLPARSLAGIRARSFNKLD